MAHFIKPIALSLLILPTTFHAQTPYALNSKSMHVPIHVVLEEYKSPSVFLPAHSAKIITGQNQTYSNQGVKQ